MKTSLAQKLITTLLTMLVILSADLAVSFLNWLIMSSGQNRNLHILTLIGMGAVLIFFYIIVTNIQKFSAWAVSLFVKLGKATFGRTLGLLVTVPVIFLILYAGYYRIWFNGSLWKEIGSYLANLIR